MIEATCHTADDALTVAFDATPWFREADPESIVHVAVKGWSGEWITDALEKRPGYESLHELIAYARNRLGLESLKDPGFATFVCTRERIGSPGVARREQAGGGRRGSEPSKRLGDVRPGGPGPFQAVGPPPRFISP